jgi:CubicO group peptidase (beta-lactamase class C family)
MMSRFAILVLLASGGICAAQDTARMDQVVQSYVAKQQFMGSVLVARGTAVVFNKGYGSANLEWNIPNTSTTKFRLGSITKQFTAASILLLEERGKLSVQDPVKKYIPDARLHPRRARRRTGAGDGTDSRVRWRRAGYAPAAARSQRGVPVRAVLMLKWSSTRGWSCCQALWR